MLFTARSELPTSDEPFPVTVYHQITSGVGEPSLVEDRQTQRSLGELEPLAEGLRTHLLDLLVREPTAGQITIVIGVEGLAAPAGV